MNTSSLMPAEPAKRLQSIDVVRGVIMILMAIDHVRLYGGVPTDGDAAHFLTRWITHFCAPAFAFLAGTSAFLHGRRLGDMALLRAHVLRRGAILVLLELTIVRLGWTFNLDFRNFTLAGVLWMLGWCMILLSLLVRASPRTVGIVGVTIMVLQSAIHPLASATPALSALWSLVFLGGRVPFGESGYALEVLYTIVPWVGVMAAGYGFGALMTRDTARRDRICLRLGLGMTAAWLVVGTVRAWSAGGELPLWIGELNQNKYRDSQLFLLMTLGPIIACLPYAQRMRGWLAQVLTVFGKAPLLYYVLHVWLIHLASLITFGIKRGGYERAWFDTAPYASVPDDMQWPLWNVYLVWAVCVVLLYFPCRWLVGITSRGGRAWTRYL